MSNTPGTYWNVQMKDGSTKEITALEYSETDTAHIFVLDDGAGTVEITKSEIESCTCTGIKPGFV